MILLGGVHDKAAGVMPLQSHPGDPVHTNLHFEGVNVGTSEPLEIECSPRDLYGTAFEDLSAHHPLKTLALQPMLFQ